MDNKFRRAALEGVERAYLLDYAGSAMRFTGLSMLLIQDDQGRIISSGHFRNEYDRLEPDLPRLLAVAPGGMALVEARTAEAALLALARVDSLRLGGRRFTLVGGVAVDSSFLARLAPDSELTVAPALPSDTLVRVDTAAQVVSALALPFVGLGDSARLREARIVVTHSLAPLAALRRRVDAAFVAAALLTAAIALLLASWLSSLISRPLGELARRTAEIDMERLDVTFESERADEIGMLTRLLGAMTERLRVGAAQLREAERRIAVGDLARQGERRTELADELPAVQTDPVVLRRILENLVGNALDSLESRSGTVTVLTARAAGADDGRPVVRITVADTGKGMSREELNRAFDDFYTTKPGGTGLGLSIVRRLVLDANGALRVETEPGGGSKFIVELPGAGA